MRDTGDVTSPLPRQVPSDETSPDEVSLTGGTSNRGLVVRVGDTVRRPPRPTGPSTHALLAHLHEVGFAGAPQYLGEDDRGREVLTYIPGTAIIPPYPEWSLTDDALESVARLLRTFHDAVSSFDPAGHAWPCRVPGEFVGTMVSHNDPNLDNVIFRDGVAVGLIDFDLASPGRREWDVAGAARLWCPLRVDVDITDARMGRALSRFRRFVDAYDHPTLDRNLIVEAVLRHHDWSYAIVQREVDQGHAAFTEFWHGGGAARAGRTAEFYRIGEATLRNALGV